MLIALASYLVIAVVCMLVVTDPEVNRIRYGLLWPVVVLVVFGEWALKRFCFGWAIPPLFHDWLQRRDARFYGVSTKRMMIGVIRVGKL